MVITYSGYKKEDLRGCYMAADSDPDNGFNLITNPKGIALLTVLWVLTILMVIALSFTYLARTETYSTLYFKEGIENKFLAEAGIERGIMELFYRQKYLPAKVLLEGNEVWKTDGTPYTMSLGDGTYTVKIFDESGKIDLNSSPENLLRNLVNSLGVEGAELDTIVDCIQDWRDKDDFVRLHGAESDYYLSLPNPYKAKNAAFDTLEELLMVKGVTRELCFGSGKKKGLIEFLTVQNKTGKINANAAPREVLMALPGMSAEVAKAIIEYRQTQEIKVIQEIVPLLGTNQAQIMQFLSIAPSGTFTIEAVGYKKKPRLGSGIRATVALQGNNNYKIVYYKTPVTLRKDEPIS
jgi:general secretion pathway protein K